VWDSGDADVARFDGRDVLRALEERAWNVGAGRPIAAKLRVELVSGARAAVYVWPPNRVRIAGAEDEDVVWRLLDAIGFTRVSTEAARAPDLWSLDPFIAGEDEWRAWLGDDYAKLERARLFVPHQRRALAHPSFPDHGRVLVAMPREEEDGFYAVSMDPDVPSLALAAKDLAAKRLDVVALARAIAKDIGADGDPREIEQGGVIDLGRRALGPATAHVFLLPRAVSLSGRALFEHLSLRAGHGTPVLIRPRGRSTGSGLREVELATLAGPYDALLESIVRVLGVAKEVDAVLLAPKEARLVLDEASLAVWLDGVAMVKARESHARYLIALAKKGPLSAKEVVTALGMKNAQDTMARDLARRTPQAIEASFTAQKKKAPKDARDVVVNDGRGYRIGLPFWVRS
jgi:hypothetical protein